MVTRFVDLFFSIGIGQFQPNQGRRDNSHFHGISIFLLSWIGLDWIGLNQIECDMFLKWAKSNLSVRSVDNLKISFAAAQFPFGIQKNQSYRNCPFGKGNQIWHGENQTFSEASKSF